MLPIEPHLLALFDETVLAISEGGHELVIWELNDTSLRLLGMLHSNGLISNVSAVVDPRSQFRGRLVSGCPVIAPEEVAQAPLDTLVITSDAEKEKALEAFVRHDARCPRIVFAGDGHYAFRDAVFDAIVRSCPVKSKAGGYPAMLTHLYQALTYVATRKLEGSVVEFGVYQGGTTVFMAKVLAHYGHSVKIYAFDTFKGFPPPRSALDTYSDVSCEFPDYSTVRNYCAPYNIELVAGDISETYTRLANLPLSLSFIDTDNYSAARVALELCASQTVAGGVIALDHYYSPGWLRTIGERIAARQVLDAAAFFHLHGTGVFIKW